MYGTILAFPGLIAYFTLPFILKKNIKVTLTLASPLTSPVHFSMNKWKGVFTPQKRARSIASETLPKATSREKDRDAQGEISSAESQRMFG